MSFFFPLDDFLVPNQTQGCILFTSGLGTSEVMGHSSGVTLIHQRLNIPAK